jgi:MFS family permease
MAPSRYAADMAEGIPERLDRLPWRGWHYRVVGALAVTWLLDGLEGSLGGSLAGALKSPHALGFSDAQLGLSSSLYLSGAVAGAVVFGYMADRYGRRRLFNWTLLLYLCATAATGLSWNLASFSFFRALTGAGIGGEYAAINSAVDELIPARLRGRVDIWINGTFWVGIILGSVVSTALLASETFGIEWGWRVAFCSGIPIGVLVLFMRRYIPESPRWLLNSGREQEAESEMQRIEDEVAGSAYVRSPLFKQAVNRHAGTSLRRFFRLMTGPYRSRAALCLFLMVAQAFFYNSVFFSLALVLLRFYGMGADDLGYSFIPIALTNFLGPVVLGSLFDTIGRKPMICATFVLSGGVLLCSGWLFLNGRLTAHEQVLWWSITFFFGSSAASSAYLTVSELFPQDIRATSIACFYAVGTLFGGICGPFIFGRLMGDARKPLFEGYAVGATMMIVAGLAEAIWGIKAEGRSLEALNADSRSSTESVSP